MEKCMRCAGVAKGSVHSLQLRPIQHAVESHAARSPRSVTSVSTEDESAQIRL
eukprot:m.91196 g.91196  ORF g.91196 m.91196 type:complete len:53 (+) comp11923_c0_seq1:156-314(+)